MSRQNHSTEMHAECKILVMDILTDTSVLTLTKTHLLRLEERLKKEIQGLEVEIGQANSLLRLLLDRLSLV